MNNKLSIQDLVSAMTERYGMDTKSANAFVKTVFEIIEEYISNDKLVKIKGLGTFKLVSVSDRESINVNTGERILIAGHSKLSFTPDAALKDAVNRPFSDFETTVLRDTTSTEDMERVPSVDATDNQADAKVDNNIVEELIEEQEDTSSTTAVEVAVGDTTIEDAPLLIDDSAEGNEPQDKEEKAEVQSNVMEEQMPVVYETSKISEESQIQGNPMYPMAAESIDATDECKCKHRTHIWIYTLLTLLLMGLSYYAGYNHLHNMFEVSLYPEGEVEAQPLVKPVDNTVSQDKQPVKSTVSNDSIQQDSASVAPVVVKSQVSEEDPAAIAKYFPQVKNGEYWIVGDAGHIHYMQVGETLYRIAQKELGSQDLVRYLIVFNDFEDPNVIHKGDPIRIPKLVKK